MKKAAWRDTLQTTHKFAFQFFQNCYAHALAKLQNATRWQAQFPKRIRIAVVGAFGLGILVQALLNQFFIERHQQSLAEAATRLPPVTAAAAKRMDLRNQFTTQAYLQAWKEVTLHPLSNVSVRAVSVSIGSWVKQGAVLATTNSQSQAMRAELDRIDSQLRNLDFGVTMALAKKSFLSQNELTQKELEHKADKLRKKLAEIENTGALQAPIDGLISEINLKAGDYIDNPNQYYVKIADPSALKIQLYLPQMIAEKLAVGATAALQRQGVNDFGQDEITKASATISAVAPVVDPKTGSVYVELVAKDIPVGWIAGMYVEVALTTDLAPNAIVIPNQSIVFENDKAYIYKIQYPEAAASTNVRNPAGETSTSISEVTVQKVAVELGMRDAKFTEVQAGIDEFEGLVLEGLNGLSDGAKVEIIQ